MLILDEVCISRHGNKVIKDFGVCVMPGSVIALQCSRNGDIGALLEVLAGVKTPDSGEILVDGVFLKEDRRIYRRNTTYLSGMSLLYPQSTLLQNLIAFARIHDVDLSLAGLIKSFDLEPYLAMPVHLLPNQICKAACICIEIMKHSKLIIISAVYMDLDKQSRWAFFNSIDAKCKSGAIAIICDPNTAPELKGCCTWTL